MSRFTAKIIVQGARRKLFLESSCGYWQKSCSFPNFRTRLWHSYEASAVSEDHGARCEKETISRIELWVLAEKLLIPQLQNKAMTLLQSISEDHGARCEKETISRIELWKLLIPQLQNKAMTLLRSVGRTSPSIGRALKETCTVPEWRISPQDIDQGRNTVWIHRLWIQRLLPTFLRRCSVEIRAICIITLPDLSRRSQTYSSSIHYVRAGVSSRRTAGANWLARPTTQTIRYLATMTKDQGLWES